MTLPGSPLSRQAFQKQSVPATAYVNVILRFLIGGVLCYAGFMKAVGPSAEFAAAIDAYKILPAALATPLALGLPWVEMWLGLFLVFGYELRGSAVTAALLFTVFLSVLLSVQVRGLVLTTCGCFGADALSPRISMMLDAGLLAGTIWLVFKTSDTSAYSLDSWIHRRPPSRR